MRLAVPELGPPYDDTAADARPGTGPRAARPARRLALVAPAGGTAGPAGAAAQAAHAPAGSPGAWPSQFAQVLAETLAGARPPAQIARWTTEQARRRIGQLGPMLAAGRQPRVRRVIVTSPASGVIEMTVVVGVGSGVRAVAVRLEHAGTAADGGRRGQPAGPGDRRPPAPAQRGWLCTAVEAA